MDNERRQKMVAVVEDDESYRAALQRLLKSAGLSPLAFASPEDFLKSGQQRATGCLIADIRMSGMSGLDLQARLNTEQSPIPTLFQTAPAEAKMRLRSTRLH